MKQWESRALRWHEARYGSTRIQLDLPLELAQAFLNSIEHSLGHLEDSDSTMSQRRADAVLFMAETSLQSAGGEYASADRYQVVVSVEASELSTSKAATSDTNCDTNNSYTPLKRPAVKGAGPIARETARRIACDCSFTIIKKSNEEPINIGRKSRIWPAAMARAIKDRDQHCQFPGCDHTQNIQIHHIKHWADNGETSIQNGVAVCRFHHTLLHQGGYTIQRVADHKQHLNEQFARQQNANDTCQFEFEKNLRDDKSSFDKIRKLSPTRYRFRVLDANWQDIRDGQSFNVESDHFHQSTSEPLDVARVAYEYTHDGNYSSILKNGERGENKVAEHEHEYSLAWLAKLNCPKLSSSFCQSP